MAGAGDLAIRCRTYLEKGPPKTMKEYVPGSLTEVIIAQGAQGAELDPELRELGGLIMLESANYKSYKDAATRKYMQLGAQLVQEVLDRK